MRKTVFLLLASCLIFPLAARAQQPNFNYLGSQSSATVATANTFANPSVLPQQTGRQSCVIQYRPVVNVLTSTTLGFVFFGSSAPTGTLTSFVLTAFAFFNCEEGTEAEGNAVWLSSTQTGDTFTIKVK